MASLFRTSSLFFMEAPRVRQTAYAAWALFAGWSHFQARNGFSCAIPNPAGVLHARVTVQMIARECLLQ